MQLPLREGSVLICTFWYALGVTLADWQSIAKALGAVIPCYPPLRADKRLLERLETEGKRRRGGNCRRGNSRADDL